MAVEIPEIFDVPEDELVARINRLPGESVAWALVPISKQKGKDQPVWVELRLPKTPDCRFVYVRPAHTLITHTIVIPILLGWMIRGSTGVHVFHVDDQCPWIELHEVQPDELIIHDGFNLLMVIAMFFIAVASFIQWRLCRHRRRMAPALEVEAAAVDDIVEVAEAAAHSVPLVNDIAIGVNFPLPNLADYGLEDILRRAVEQRLSDRQLEQIRLAWAAGLHAQAKLEGRVIHVRPARAVQQRVNRYYAVLQTNTRMRVTRIYGSWDSCIPDVILHQADGQVPLRYTTLGGRRLPLYNGVPELHPDATFHAWTELYEARAYVIGAVGLLAWGLWDGVVLP